MPYVGSKQLKGLYILADTVSVTSEQTGGRLCVHRHIVLAASLVFFIEVCFHM